MPDTMTVLADWKTWMGASYSPQSIDMHWGTVLRFFRDVPKPLTEVTEGDVAAWLETFPFRSATRSTYSYGLGNLFGYALRHGYIERDPTADIQVKAPPEKEPRALTGDEYSAVLKAAEAAHPVRGYTVELLLYSAGRITELLNLRWEDLEADGIVLRKTKGGKERTVPWSDGLVRAIEGLRGYFGEQDRVLPRSAQTVAVWLKQAGDDAGVPKVHPHLFRSTSATMMLKASAEDGMKARPDAIQAVLGHSKITTTSRYWSATHEDKHVAVGMLPAPKSDEPKIRLLPGGVG